MKAVRRALSPQMAIISVLSFVVVWLLGGPTQPWDFSATWAFLFLLGIAYLPVVLLAVWRKTLSMKNSAFLFGFPLLFGMVGFSVELGENVGAWIESWWFITLCLITGFLIGVMLLEWEFNWRQDPTFVVQPSDAWYLGQIAFMFYWAPRAAIMLIADSWQGIATAAALAAGFGVTAVLQDKARKQRISAGLTR